MSNSNHPLNSSNPLRYTKLKATRLDNLPHREACVCADAQTEAAGRHFGRWQTPMGVASGQAPRRASKAQGQQKPSPSPSRDGNLHALQDIRASCLPAEQHRKASPVHTARKCQPTFFLNLY